MLQTNYDATQDNNPNNLNPQHQHQQRANYTSWKISGHC